MMNTTALTCRLCFPLLLISILSGCNSLPEKPSDTNDNNSGINDPANTANIKTLSLNAQNSDIAPDGSSFSTDTLYSLLVAEVAASRQQYDTTIDNYVAQAKATQDKSIIIRATRVTQFLLAHPESIEMGLLWLEQEPNNIEATTTVANAYIELQQPLKALTYTEQLIEHHTDDNDTSTHTLDGGALIETLANYSRRSSPEVLSLLIERIQRLSTKHPTLAGIKVGLSTLYQTANQPEPAREWIDRALAQEPERITAIIQDVRLLQATQQNALALNKLEQHLKGSPHSHRLRLVYARLLSQSDIQQAYAQFTILSEQAPQQLELRFSRALLATELEKMDIALPLLESLLAANYQVDNVNFYLGHIHDFQESTDTALKYYLAVKQGNNYLPAQYRIAKIHITNQDIEKTQQLFNTLRQQLPDKAKLLYEDESSLLVQHQANTAALILLNKAIALFPDSSTLRYERATVYERQDKLALMEKDFRHVLAIDPDNVAALNGLGYLLAIHTARYDEAYQLIKQALALSPEDPSVIDSMGWVLFKKGQTKEAITYLRRAYKKLPDPEVAAHLGEALWVNGEQAAAKTIFNESLTNNPDSEKILEPVRRLNISL